MDRTTTDLYSEAVREDWARRTVADAGKSWATHLAKFSGAVLPRQGTGTGRGHHAVDAWLDEAATP